MNYMNDRLSSANVLSQVNVDVYFQPYAVILLLDVILKYFYILFETRKNADSDRYRYRLKEQNHVQHDRDQLSYK